MAATSRGKLSSTKVAPGHYKIKPDDAMLPRPATPEDRGRSSFSSVRENDSGLAQTFTSSDVSSYSKACEEAVDDSPADMMEGVEFVAPLTLPHSKLHGSWRPADAFRGWKQIQVRGKSASKSFSDLQMLNRVWSGPSVISHSLGNRPGDSPMERLPIEVLGAIIDLLFVEKPTLGETTRNEDLRALLLTSRTLYAAAIATLYRHITIPHSKIFRKFLTQVTAYPALGLIVRRLDFSHFNPSALFTTAQERAEAQNLTSKTLLQCLDLTPNLQEFLAQEHISENLRADVLRKLFFNLPQLRAIDFCGCSDRDYKQAFEAILPGPWPDSLSISRLSFHKNIILNATVFETILPRLTHLTHLDVAGCRVTDQALMSIPHSARITHLNLAKCNRLSARTIIDFIAHHPAVASSLVVLSLGTDAASHQMLDEDDVSELLQILPKSLKSLSLKGSKMMPSHIPLLQPLVSHLEELALGRSVSVADVNELFAPSEDSAPHSLRYLDFSDLFAAKDMDPLFERWCYLLKTDSAPLEVIEISDKVHARMCTSRGALNKAGWSLRDFGQRYWMVREGPGVPRDDPYRPWKMGAESWGARKLPVARAEVGGMYGSFMFKRKL